MIIGDKNIQEIIITTADGEVLAAVSDTEIIEKSGVSVILKELA